MPTICTFPLRYISNIQICNTNLYEPWTFIVVQIYFAQTHRLRGRRVVASRASPNSFPASRAPNPIFHLYASCTATFEISPVAAGRGAGGDGGTWSCGIGRERRASRNLACPKNWNVIQSHDGLPTTTSTSNKTTANFWLIFGMFSLENEVEGKT